MESRRILDKNTLEEFRSEITRSKAKPSHLETIARSIHFITKGRPISEVMSELQEKKRMFGILK